MQNWLKENRFKSALISILVINIIVWGFYFSLPDGKLHVKVYDVGQGDSIFIRTPEGKNILIDGGPDNKVLEYLGKDIPFYSKNIDLVILTHPDADHLSGLVEVLKQYKVKQVWVNGKDKNSRIYQDWKRTLEELNINVQKVNASHKFTFGENLVLDVVWPPKDFDSSQTNLSAIVVKLSYGSFDSLLTADADKSVQPYTSSRSQVEFFKVPHHGAAESVSEEFLKLISPEVSVISVGEKNPYEHPKQITLDLLQKSGSKIYRTDKDGTIEVVSDGKIWYVITGS